MKLFRYAAFTLTLLVVLSLTAYKTISAQNAAVQAAIPTNIRFDKMIMGLSNPLLVTHAGDGSDRLFIVEKTGKILIYKNSALNPIPFLDASSIITADGERGLLSLAFHPNYTTNGRFFIYYTNINGDITIARYNVSAADPDLADNSSGVILLTIPKIYKNHNGGTLAFGPDGYLYASIGDGGNHGDPNGNGQNKTTLLGKILRLDVSGSSYTIPTNNPFYSDANPNVKKEIWALGLRNPWRVSFDRNTGDLYIGDVGQNDWEEIDFQSAASAGGGNYGWRCYEGNHAFNTAGCLAISNFTFPIIEYAHTIIAPDDNGCSVTGGYVYRGTQFVRLQGVYLYADFCKGKVFGSKNISGQWTSTLIRDTNYKIASFGEDEQGEIYLTDFLSGSVFHIVEAPLITNVYASVGAQDGWILESSEASNVGGTLNVAAANFRVGDDATNKQYRGVLSFNTGSTLPDNAIVTGAALKVKKSGGADLVASFQGFMADIKFGSFNTSALQGADFQTSASKSYGPFTPPLISGRYSIPLTNAKAYINKLGLTQIRLRFKLDDNNDAIANYVNFFSGDAIVAADRPQLTVQYYLP